MDDVQNQLVGRGFFLRDWGLLSSVLAYPLTTLQGQKVYPSPWLKLAALLDSIERNHPLIDSNKRLGYLLVALIFRGDAVGR